MSPGPARRRDGELDARTVVFAVRAGFRAVAGWKVLLIAAATLLPLLLFAGLFVSSGSTAGGAQSCVVKGESGNGIPANYVPWLGKAAVKYKLGPKGFSIVAAIHSVESDFGRSTLPGVHSGANFAGAAGPGQFLAASWETYGQDADGDGVKDVYAIPDSIYGTANYMHLSGAPKDWHSAIFAYNHAEWYVEEVEAKAAQLGGQVVCRPAPGVVLTGAAELQRVETLYQPLAFQAIPSRYWVGGGAPGVVDSRIWPDVMWVLQTFGLRVTASRETGHNTHGDGTALDLVPAVGEGWDESALRAAEVLGWRSDCGASGTAPVCPLMPAIQFIGYNGYPLHGDPAHAGSNAHLHISWQGSSYGCAELCPPPRWVRVFPLSS